MGSSYFRGMNTEAGKQRTPCLRLKAGGTGFFKLAGELRGVDLLSTGSASRGGDGFARNLVVSASDSIK